MEMSLQQLRMLREVAKRHTIAAAAESLGYTSSAVSQQLSGLEKATGVAVLERVGRNVRLTDAGRELVRHAEDLLAGMEAAQVAVERLGAEARGVLTVAVFESVAATLLVPLLDRLAEHHPGITLRTLQLDPDAAMDALASGDIDLAFAIDYPHAPAPRREDLDRCVLLEDVFHLVVAEGDPVSGPRVPLAEVADRCFISSPSHLSCGRGVLAACRDAGFEPDLTHQIDDYATTLHLVAAGAGIALVPDLALVRVPAGLRILEVESHLARTIELVHRSASAERPAIVAVREALVGVVAELGLRRTAAAA